MSQSVASNASISMFANGFYLVSRLLLPPLILLYLPLAEYGLWSICFVLIMYIGLVDAGFSSVYVRQVAIFHAAGDDAAINRLLSTGIICLSLLAGLVWLALYEALPWVLDMLSVANAQRETASILIPATAAMFLLDLTLGAYCYVLHGLQRIREEKQVAIAGYVLEPLLIWLFLHQGLGIYGLLLAFALRYLWSLSAFMYLAHRFLPDLSVRPRYFDRQMLRHFWGFGLSVQFSTLLGTVLFSLDRVLAGSLLGPKGVALFELATKLPVSALTIPSAIAQVTLPAAAGLLGQQRLSEIQPLFQQTTRSVALLSSLPLAFIALFAPHIALAWLGDTPELSHLPLIMALTAFWCHLHISSGPGSAIFRALGKLHNEFIYHFLRLGLLGIALSLSLFYWAHDPVLGLAYGLLIGNACAAVLYLLYNQQQLSLSAWQLLRDVLYPALLPYALATLVWLCAPALSSRHNSLLVVFGFGLLYSLLWAGLMWCQLQTAEKQQLRQLWARSRLSLRRQQ